MFRLRLWKDLGAVIPAPKLIFKCFFKSCSLSAKLDWKAFTLPSWTVSLFKVFFPHITIVLSVIILYYYYTEIKNAPLLSFHMLCWNISFLSLLEEPSDIYTLLWEWQMKGFMTCVTCIKCCQERFKHVHSLPTSAYTNTGTPV